MKQYSILTDKLLDAKQVSTMLGYSLQHTYRILRGIKPVKPRPNADARYWASDIDALLNAPK